MGRYMQLFVRSDAYTIARALVPLDLHHIHHLLSSHSKAVQSCNGSHDVTRFPPPASGAWLSALLALFPAVCLLRTHAFHLTIMSAIGLAVCLVGTIVPPTRRIFRSIPALESAYAASILAFTALLAGGGVCAHSHPTRMAVFTLALHAVALMCSGPGMTMHFFPELLASSRMPPSLAVFLSRQCTRLFFGTGETLHQ